MTSSRMKLSEGDNASEGNLGTGGVREELVEGKVSLPPGRIGLSRGVPVPAAEVLGATVVERVGKGVVGGARNCVCSV